MFDKTTIIKEIRDGITKRFEKEEASLFESALDIWLSWMENGGQSTSCESMSNLGRRFRGFFDDLNERSKPGYSAKDPYG
jgi:hypothetical protein